MKTHAPPNFLGLSLLFVLSIGIGVFLGVRRGLAFSPGGLTAKTRSGTNLGGFTSHAEFEADCGRCHQPLQSLQADLCLDCHTKEAAEIAASEGIHGQVTGQTCASCHPDHRGGDFDPSEAALSHFDHSTTRFSLIRHQVDYDLTLLECSECHPAGEANFTVSIRACGECHARHDPGFAQQHEADFGLDCTACHDGQDTIARFDHAASSFPLEAAHQEARCADCHKEAAFADLSTACQDCHAEPEAHRGFFSTDCAGCHNPAAWQPASLDGVSFDHETGTRFSLRLHLEDNQGQTITCQDCHGGPDLAGMAADLNDCTNCHEQMQPGSMAPHQDEFGTACLDCHDGTDRMSNFDHNRFYPLEGAHVDTGCADCHVDKVYAGTPRACSACHAEPEIHAGYFGLDCESCHTAQAWLPAYLREHAFPIDHGEDGPVDCMVCHPSTYIEYTCYGCHEHQPGEMIQEHREENISDAELLQCAQCHPSGQKDEGDGGEHND